MNNNFEPTGHLEIPPATAIRLWKIEALDSRRKHVGFRSQDDEREFICFRCDKELAFELTHKLLGDGVIMEINQ